MRSCDSVNILYENEVSSPPALDSPSNNPQKGKVSNEPVHPKFRLWYSRCNKII